MNRPIGDDDIVISGIGCKLPQMDNLPEVIEKLLEGSDLITQNSEKLEGVFKVLPGFEGNINGVKNFDNTFFGISNIVCRSMDPYTRLILERTFEAVIDAGINPADLKGSNACVASGSTISPFDLAWQADYKGGYGIMGKNRCMNANRVSYWLDLNGTSVALDGNFANGIINLVNGWEEIKKGRCDLALVSTANLNSPEVLQQLNDFKCLSPDGKSRSYDDSANGWCPGEAIVVFVLQRAKFAKRCYAIIDHALSKCYGERIDILHNPSQEYWEKMLNEFYAQSNVNVNDVCYVEGQGTGIREEDAEELNALSNVFCKSRKNPLLVGCVKSNIGHTQAAAASCGIIKAIICLENGIIPRNIHYSKINSLAKGNKIEIVTENTKIPENGLVAVNAHGVGGIYAHVVLRGNPKIKKKEYDGIPRLVLLSARTDAHMDDIIDKIESSPIDVEQIALLQDLNSKRMDKYLSRGYTILPKADNISFREHTVFGQEKRPVWFIFSGMGSQWPEMGRRLMEIPLFRESIEKSHKILAEKNLDLINIITTDDLRIFDNILHSFVGIAAVQIALVDILNALNIVPDYMIGHSVGELGCSYADGCLTAEQTILCAYSRGKASIETELVKGFMAAVGKGYNEIKDELPEGIEVACHNASNSCTISGPADLVKKYVLELQERKIFARTVNVSNIAYHSQYIKPAAPKLLQYLQEVIPEPKLRSSKWISTSNLEADWDKEVAKYCSAEYHTNNLLSSVFFEEGSKHIPKNAICIEIAPHGLLQAILKRSLGSECTNIPLTNRLATDPLQFFLQAIGKLFMVGLEPQVLNLYGKIEYPVSRGTAPINHFIRWTHEYEIPLLRTVVSKKVMYPLKDHFLKISEDGNGYIINDINCYPLSILLHLIWVIFTSSLNKAIEECPVIFENLRTEEPTAITDIEIDEDAFIFISAASGNFEMIADRVILEGSIKLLEEEREIENFVFVEKTSAVNKNEIYKEFRRNGCVVGKAWRTLENVEVIDDVWKGRISVSVDIIRTIESIIQLGILKNGEELSSFSFPATIEKLIIDPKLHNEYKNSQEEINYLEAEFQSTANVAKCGGIEMKGLKLRKVPKAGLNLKFESAKFESFTGANHRDFWGFVDFCFNIICDNLGDVEINTIQITNGLQLPSIVSYLEKHFSHLKIKALTDTNDNKNKSSGHDLVICDAQSLNKAISITSESGFIFIKSPKFKNYTLPEKVSVITEYSINKEEYILLKKENSANYSLIINGKVDFITMPANDSVLFNVLKEVENSKRLTYLVGYKDPLEGFERYKKRLQKKCNSLLRWILVLDEKAPKFNPGNPFYASQLQKGLVSNIYKNGSWGCIYKKEFTEDNISSDLFWPKSNNGVSPNYIGVNVFEDSKVVEYSGIGKNKTKVIGIGTAHNNEFISDSYLKWILPPSWNLDDGSTVPLSYALAYYCLNIVKKLGGEQLQERVLITDGLSFHGLAAIAVAIFLDKRVFVTVSDKSEISLIKKLFPKLNDKDILIHEDNDFDVQLGFIAGGCDCIINNLENEKLMSVINCLTNYGKFFHLGKEDLKKNFKLGMGIFLQNISLYTISPDTIATLPRDEKIEIRDFIQKGLQDGFIKPLPKINTSLKGIGKINKNRKKVIISSESIQDQTNWLKIDSGNSYIIIGDESDAWMDILKWLLRRNVTNIVINIKNIDIQEAYDRIKMIKKSKNVILRNDGNVAGLLKDAKKLGSLAAVFLLRMFESNGLKLFTELDDLYRDPNGHLLVLSKHEDSASNICRIRTAQNFPSTNFIWGTDEIITNNALNFIEKIFGEEAVIRVSGIKKINDSEQNYSKILAEILPGSIEEFCELGNLPEDIKLVEFPTLGQKNFILKEVSPLFVIPGLQCNPKKILRPLAKKLMYPLFYAQISSQYSIRDLATLLLPNVVAMNKNSNAYNILGISWGSYIAIELSKLLEEAGGNVSLILINGPLQPLKESITAGNSLKKDLLSVIQEISTKNVIDINARNSLSTSLDQIAKKIQFSVEEQNEFRNAANFVYNNLQSMIDYDYSNIKLKGPLTILKTDQRFRDPLVKNICNNLIVYNIDISSQELFNCKKIIDVIHGTCINSAMSKETIHYCSWKKLGEFIEYDELSQIDYAKRLQDIDFQDAHAGKTIEIDL